MYYNWLEEIVRKKEEKQARQIEQESRTILKKENTHKGSEVICGLYVLPEKPKGNKHIFSGPMSFGICGCILIIANPRQG